MSREELSRKIKDTLVMKQDEVDEKIVDDLKPYLRLTEDGKPIFLCDRRKLRVVDQILLYLAARRLAYVAGLTENDKATLDEVSTILNIPKGTAGPRLDELMQSGHVLKVERGVYAITVFGLMDLTSRLRMMFGEQKEERKGIQP